MTERAERGFTLIELLIAVVILGTAILTLLYLRTSAEHRAGIYTRQRLIQQLAAAKLDEFVYGVEQNQQGTFENHKDFSYQIEVRSVSNGDPQLLECAIHVTYPQGDPGKTGDGEYVLSTWVYPEKDSPLLNYVGTGLPSGTGSTSDAVSNLLQGLRN